jgi:hypothetical protein
MTVLFLAARYKASSANRLAHFDLKGHSFVESMSICQASQEISMSVVFRLVS